MSDVKIGKYTASKIYTSQDPSQQGNFIAYQDESYRKKLYKETGIEILSINPDGSAVARIFTPAGDRKYIGDNWKANEDYAWYRLDGGGKVYLKTKACDGDRNEGIGFVWDETFIIPAGTSSIQVGGVLDWDRTFLFKNSGGNSQNQSTDSPKIWLYGKKSGSVIQYGLDPKRTTSITNPNNLSLTVEEALKIVNAESGNWTLCSSQSEDLDGIMRKNGHTKGVVPIKQSPTDRDYWKTDGNTYKDQLGITGNDYWVQIFVYLINRSWTYVTGDIDFSLPEMEVSDLKVYNIFPSGDKEKMKDAPTINEYDGEATPWWEEESNQQYSVTDCSFVSSTGSSSSITIQNGHTYTDYGTYTFTVSTWIDGVESSKQSKTIIFKVIDNTPPEKPKIIDDKDPKNIIYDMTGRLYLGPCYPTLDKFEDGVEYEAELTFYPYTDNCGTLSSSASYKDAYYQLATELKDSGYYELTVIATKTSNQMTSKRKVNFYIDNLPPDPPIINVAGVDYQGVYGEVAKIPNPVPVSIKVQKGCTYEQKVYFKKRNKDKWVEISPLLIYTDKGYYKINAIATKTKNGLKSDPSEVIFQRKIKYSWLITIDPSTKCYRTVATIHFDNDYSLKKMYKINDGEWKWYLGPIFIYENCTIYAKSLDGDDDYESNITSKVIDVIDTSAPEPAKINIQNGDVNSIFVPQVIK